MEMASALSADLLDQRDLEVVAKGDVDLLDRAQEMAARGAVDPALVAQLGRTLGPVVLLTVHVSRADIKHQDSSKETKDKAGKVTATTRTLTTTLDFDATLQVVDGATGKVLGASIFKDALKDAQRAVEVRAAYERYQQSADLTAHAAIRPQPSNGKTRTPEERLEDLERLWKKGLLSEDEYKIGRAHV